MRHRKAGVKLGRTSSHRDAMFRNMVTSLLKHDRIHTTDIKAKELRRWVDKVITLAKRGDLHARRQALAIVREKDVVHKLFEDAQNRFGQVNGGYSRIIKIGRRPGDAAPMSLIELVSAEQQTKKGKAKKKQPPVVKKESKPISEAKPDTQAATKTESEPSVAVPISEAESPEAPQEAAEAISDEASATPSADASEAAPPIEGKKE